MHCCVENCTNILVIFCISCKKPIVNHLRHRTPIRDAFWGYLSMQFSRFMFPEVTFSFSPPLGKCFIRFHQTALIGILWSFLLMIFDDLHQQSKHPGTGHRLSMRSSIFLLDPPNISETFILDYRSFPMNWKFIEYWMAHYLNWKPYSILKICWKVA